MLSNKNILITGGAGFIGSNLCDYFIAKNNHITCLDNFSTGKKASRHAAPIAIGIEAWTLRLSKRVRL